MNRSKLMLQKAQRNGYTIVYHRDAWWCVNFATLMGDIWGPCVSKRAAVQEAYAASISKKPVFEVTTYPNGVKTVKRFKSK